MIGSLWPILDDASFLLASRFYDEWLDANDRERAKPAQALRAAVDWLRRVTFAELKTLFAIEQRKAGGAALVLRSENRSNLLRSVTSPLSAFHWGPTMRGRSSIPTTGPPSHPPEREGARVNEWVRGLPIAHLRPPSIAGTSALFPALIICRGNPQVP